MPVPRKAVGGAISPTLFLYIPVSRGADLLNQHMKRVLAPMVILSIIISCKAPQFYMGESEREFLKHNRVSLVSATSRTSIYKKVNYPFGAPPVVKFFYFTDGKLTKVDEGVQSPDIIIEHRR
jgi:hypothetical protein